MSTARRTVRIALRALGFILLSIALIGVLAVWAEVRLDRALSRAPVWISGSRPPDVLPEADSVTLEVIGYNVWGLPFWLPDARRWERLPVIPEKLREMPVDLIALQEAYDPLFRRYLIGTLGHRYRRGSDALCRQTMRFAGARDCTGGLLTFSRFPIAAESFHMHEYDDDSRWEERMLGKGVLLTRVATPVGEVLVVNVHLYAGRQPEDEAVRLRQVRRLAELLGQHREIPILLVGDLNTEHPALPESIDGPPRTPTAVYHFVVDSLGFTDARPNPTEAHLTYDPTHNPHADSWYHRNLGREVFDYIFVRVPDGLTVEVSEQRTIFTDDPLSDHFGTRARIVIERAPEGEEPNDP